VLGRGGPASAGRHLWGGGGVCGGVCGGSASPKNGLLADPSRKAPSTYGSVNLVAFLSFLRQVGSI